MIGVLAVRAGEPGRGAVLRVVRDGVRARRAAARSARSSRSSSPTSSARPPWRSGATPRTCAPCSPRTMRACAPSWSASAGRWRSSSATPWWRSSVRPSCTRTTRSARSGPRSPSVTSAREAEVELRVAVNTGEALVTLDARPADGEGMVAGRRGQHRSPDPVGGAGERGAGRRDDVPGHGPRDRVSARRTRSRPRGRPSRWWCGRRWRRGQRFGQRRRAGAARRARRPRARGRRAARRPRCARGRSASRSW